MKKLLLLLTLLLWLPIAQASEAELQRASKASRAGDYKTATAIWKPLAEQGNITAQYFLGVMYHAGLGVSQDYGKALKWYRKAATQGHVEAHVFLGVMYQGLGVPKNNIYTYMWFNLAKTNGLKHTQKVIESLTKQMSFESIDKAQALAAKCWQSKYKNCPK